MPTICSPSQLLLISNSTQHGSGYLDHVEDEIRNVVGKRLRFLFIPYALRDRRAYATTVAERLRVMGFTTTSIHDVSNMARAVEDAEVIFIGGGNTFRLLKNLYDFDLIESIRRAIKAGAIYIGSSAGSIVAGPTIKTTKDMPIVQPRSFDALGLVPFQISPHYLDPEPTSTHMGETQEERILQFLEENESPVVGLREGSMLRVQSGSMHLTGPRGARIFRRDEEPVEATTGTDLREFLLQAGTPAGGRT
jgi:dipeptidase E